MGMKNVISRSLFFAVGICVLVLASFIPLSQDKVVFLDVGQGDSILIQAKTAQVLIDGGSGTKVLERLGEELPWFDRTIDVVISTHPDKDHLEGLLHVLERYKVGLVLLPHIPHTSQLQGEWLHRLQRAVENKQFAYRFAWQGQKLKLGDVTIDVLGPSNDMIRLAAAGTTNNASVITRVDFGDFSLLLSGDAERAVEKVLVEHLLNRLHVNVLKVGHHGSKTSTSQMLIDAVSPSAAVISVGVDNSFGHPHPAVMQRLENIHLWRTDEHGSVRFLRHDGQWLVTTQR